MQGQAVLHRCLQPSRPRSPAGLQLGGQPEATQAMRAATRGTAEDGGRPAPASRAPRHPPGRLRGCWCPAAPGPLQILPVPCLCAVPVAARVSPCQGQVEVLGLWGGCCSMPLCPLWPLIPWQGCPGSPGGTRPPAPLSCSSAGGPVSLHAHREVCLMAIAAATLLTGKARGDLCCWESSPASGCICPCKQLTSSPVALPGKHGLEQCCCQPRAAPQLSALSALGRGNCGHLAAGTNPCCSPRGTAWRSSETPASLPSGWTGWEAAHAGCSMDTAGLHARGSAGSPWAVPLVLQEERGCHGLGAAACWCWGMATRGPIPPPGAWCRSSHACCALSLPVPCPWCSHMCCGPAPLLPSSSIARPRPLQPPWLAARAPGRGASSLPPATARAVTLQMSEP